MAKPKPVDPWINAHVRTRASTYHTVERLAHRQGLTVPQFVRAQMEGIAARASEIDAAMDAQEASQKAAVLEQFRSIASGIEADISASMNSREMEEGRP